MFPDHRSSVTRNVTASVGIQVNLIFLPVVVSLVVVVSKYVTVSVKIRRETKEQLERLGVKPSRLLKEAIVETLRKQEIGEIARELTKLRGTLEKIPIEDVVRTIREDRDR